MYGWPMVFWFKPFQSVLLTKKLEFPQKLSVNVAWNGWRTGIRKQSPKFDAGKPY